MGFNHTYLEMMDDLQIVLEENLSVIQMKAVTEHAKQSCMFKGYLLSDNNTFDPTNFWILLVFIIEVR